MTNNLTWHTAFMRVARSTVHRFAPHPIGDNIARLDCLHYLSMLVLRLLFPLDPDPGRLSGPLGLLYCLCLYWMGLRLLFCGLAAFNIDGLCVGFLRPFLPRR